MYNQNLTKLKRNCSIRVAIILWKVIFGGCQNGVTQLRIYSYFKVLTRIIEIFLINWIKGLNQIIVSKGQWYKGTPYSDGIFLYSLFMVFFVCVCEAKIGIKVSIKFKTKESPFKFFTIRKEWLFQIVVLIFCCSNEKMKKKKKMSLSCFKQVIRSHLCTEFFFYIPYAWTFLAIGACSNLIFLCLTAMSFLGMGLFLSGKISKLESGQR